MLDDFGNNQLNTVHSDQSYYTSNDGEGVFTQITKKKFCSLGIEGFYHGRKNSFCWWAGSRAGGNYKLLNRLGKEEISGMFLGENFFWGNLERLETERKLRG